MTAQFILLVIACLLWLVAALPIPRMPPVQIGWLGLFFYGVSLLVSS